MSHEISFLLGELRNLSSMNRADILESRRELKLLNRQMTRLDRRVSTLEKPQVSTKEKALKGAATYLLPLAATLLGLWMSGGDLDKTGAFLDRVQTWRHSGPR